MEAAAYKLFYINTFFLFRFLRQRWVDRLSSAIPEKNIICFRALLLGRLCIRILACSLDIVDRRPFAWFRHVETIVSSTVALLKLSMLEFGLVINPIVGLGFSLSKSVISYCCWVTNVIYIISLSFIPNLQISPCGLTGASFRGWGWRGEDLRCDWLKTTTTRPLQGTRTNMGPTPKRVSAAPENQHLQKCLEWICHRFPGSIWMALFSNVSNSWPPVVTCRKSLSGIRWLDLLRRWVRCVEDF